MVHWLSFHAPYRCRHAGDCCTAGWPIPVELNVLDRARVARSQGRLALDAVNGLEPFVFPPNAPADTPALLATAHGACVFYRAAPTGSCALHHALGHEALPLACQQFPRVSVTAGGRTSVTLSNYCPTARGLLDSPGPVTVVRESAQRSAHDYVGLTTGDWPPLLRPGMLMDWDAWWDWEARSVAWLSDTSPAVGLAGLRRVIERVRTWAPGAGSLGDRIRDSFDRARDEDPTEDRALLPAERYLEDVLSAVPDDLRPPESALAGTAPSLRAHQRFLAAHAFANWTAYLGAGLLTWLRSIEAADGLLRCGLGIREADLLLRHLADPYALARRWSDAETV